MKKILVTGANGQLAKCLIDAAPKSEDYKVDYLSRAALDITDEVSVLEHFSSNTYDYCINTAAYTNVEKAESEQTQAFLVNAASVQFLANACKNQATTLIHISTDYVFDGTKSTAYEETDATNPINVYGASKLKGELLLSQTMEQYFILRTSWLYSQYGHNFLNTILKHLAAGKDLTITTEQVGTPTNANDLAQCIWQIIISETKAYGLYHYSNNGEATWFDFASEILKVSPLLSNSKLAKTDHYPTFAKRPKKVSFLQQK
ncbi:dTDP-4-dehydrorhamnose reductase [unidentified eubacterium SCB49]|nr:dTDP-4-dehydrorhamnose reductase [unidentified eubacterium SCB49]